MALKSAEIRKMNKDERRKKLLELLDELTHEHGIKAMGGAPTSPGKIRALRKELARMKTITHEMKEA